MVDFNSMPPLPRSQETGLENRKTASVTPTQGNFTTRPSVGFPNQPGYRPAGYGFPLQPQASPPPSQQGHILTRLLQPFVQVLNFPLERVAGQIFSFFYGSKRDIEDEKDREKRARNHFVSQTTAAERKVEESEQSQLGGGQ